MTATGIHLREYQEEAVGAAWSAWASGMQRPAVVLPTGSGKTVVFSGLIRQFVEVWKPSTNASWGRPYRVVVLVHRDELADQAIDKLRTAAPDLVIGKVKAADNEVTADVMVCSVQTLARERRMRQLLDAADAVGEIGLVIVDECHHATAKSYRDIMAALGCYSGLKDDEEDYRAGTKCVGFTATLKRGDGVGLGDVWNDVVYSRSVLWMISQGHLVDVRGREIESGMDLASVKKTGGDYAAGALGDALMESGGPALIARTVLQHAPERRTIVFTPTVATTAETVRELDKRGVRCAAVSGATPREERLAIYSAFRSGGITVMVNCMVLTEGADFPMADCAVIARPTQSAPLFIQMVGRVLRPWPGKTDALVIDLAGTGGRISTLIDLEPGLVTAPADGESLAEAYIRQEEHADRVEHHTGNTAFLLKHRDLDIFTASSHVWLRTAGGVMFIPVGGGFVLLWPRENGTWDVYGWPERVTSQARPRRLHKGLSLGMATAWAETEAEEHASFGVQRQATWRRRTPPRAMVTKAKSMGLRVTDAMTQGVISDAMAVKLASRALDPHAAKV